MDNLPAATKKTLVDFSGEKSYAYETGFPLGIVEGEVAYLNNHVSMKILYHTSPDFVGRRIVGFEVEPQSIKHSEFDEKNPTAVPETCLRPLQWQSVSGEEAGEIVFTYSVDWEYHNVKWSSRWDVYLTMTDTQIHWFSIVNSLLILIFLSGMVAMIIMRTLHADFRRYHEMDTQEEAQEETGWKLVHGDVFRPPPFRMLLSVLIGSGVQVFSMGIITLVFALLGFLSPANRGGLMTAVVVLFLLMSLFSGYFSARMYKLFKGTEWKQNAIFVSPTNVFPRIVY
jgi:transmembrane 9 superfamily member 2/4